LPVLIDKRYGTDSAHQLSLSFSTSFATKFVESNGITLAYGYNFTDIIGLEIGGGYFFGSESSIMNTVRANFGAQEPPLSDLYQLQWMANANVVIVPFYGRVSFASEFDPSWDLFALAGGGVFGVRKQFGPDGASSFESKVAPGFNFGGGLRFYWTMFNTRTALRLEFREYFFPDPTTDAELSPDSDVDSITWNLHFQAGLQFNFGGL
jgi:outer membrane beta-barrel protein